jgi:hypothetical protein
MSDRANSLLVVLDENTRIEDDLQPLIAAIRMLHGVAHVTANLSDPIPESIGAMRERTRLTRAIYKALEETP